MKIAALLFLLPVVALACGEESPVRCPGLKVNTGPLEKLTKCQPVNELRPVRRMDVYVDWATRALPRASQKLEEFARTCADYKKNPSQDQLVINRLSGEGRRAMEMAQTAQQESERAIEELGGVASAISTLGGADCALQMEQARGQIGVLQKNLETKIQMVSGCSSGTPLLTGRCSTRYPTNPGGRNCGWGGCVQNDDGTWSPRGCTR